jgi:signal peptidase II
MRYLAAAALIILFDQGSKFWVQTALPLGRPAPFLPPLVYFTYVRNPGAAFSLFPQQRPLLIAAAALSGILAWRYRDAIARQSALFRWGLTCGLAGASGNLLDRLRLGRVVDFIDIRVWPVFNLADVFICLGVSLMVWSLWRNAGDSGEGR